MRISNYLLLFIAPQSLLDSKQAKKASEKKKKKNERIIVNRYIDICIDKYDIFSSKIFPVA